jgi:hypothetical protein
MMNEGATAMTAQRPSPHEPDRTASESPETRIMTLNEAADAYPGEWIFMNVKEIDEHDQPVAGIVLAHHPTEDGIQPVIMRTIEDLKQNRSAYTGGFMAYCGPRFRTNEEWQMYRRRLKAARDHSA